MTIRDMVARHSDYDETMDFVPTPPFATRALYEHVAPNLKDHAHRLSVWDPAAGQGHMGKVFCEYGHLDVFLSDVAEYPLSYSNWGTWAIEDYLAPPSTDAPPIDVVITNPPYKHLGAFMERALSEVRFGVGMLVRIQALESEARYNTLYKDRPPTQIAFFANRIPFKSGIVVKKAPKMFFHVWLWWEKDESGGLLPPRPPIWIPYDVQQQLEKDSDYE